MTKKPAIEEQAFISLARTTDLLGRKLEACVRAAGISPNQYNVLRILRGSPQGLTGRDIACRMISRDPDITRLLDRLEQRGLVSRCRETKDRRMVHTRITDRGLSLLAELDTPITEIHQEQLGHLGAERLELLIELLEKASEKVH
jgi:DNA-binding MarR family transcriptional regulator